MQNYITKELKTLRVIQSKADAIECKIISKSLRIKKCCYNLINVINVRKHLKGIQAEADATCEKSILNITMHSQRNHNVID